MFVLLSKINHSCQVEGYEDGAITSPAHVPSANTVYASTVEEGYGVHVAIRAIAAGEQILTNYLKGILFMSRRERRAKLLAQKLFSCGCAVCKMECIERAFVCPRSTCTGKCLPSAHSARRDVRLKGDTANTVHLDGGHVEEVTVEPGEYDTAEELWTCQECGEATEEIPFFAALARLRSSSASSSSSSPLDTAHLAAQWRRLEDKWVDLRCVTAA